ncbi:hypothetical protein ILUMI_25703 [Ignelater luminosus]|uniref:Ferritin n=1 Tax=Ignelater luminosus TaxID=2038154 RepID=A0A8K0C9F9_IGNLU|nr:hypothetical protein ILUMI_25703 [Ignelater luminosus]
MSYSNYTAVKLGKSLSRLKEELITSKKLLIGYIHPLKPTLHKDHLTSIKEDGYKSNVNGINLKENKRIFSRITDYAKLMVNSNKNLISFVNSTYFDKNSKALADPKLNSAFSRNAKFVNQNYARYPEINGFKHLSSSCSSGNDCTKPPPKQCQPGRHCYHKETEDAVNQQILAEFNACYAYLSMACYFGRTEVALPGCQGFFMRMHEEEHEHALYFINYQIMRGGYVHLYPLTIPECQDWKSIHHALSVAVEMEKLVKKKLILLYNVAEKHHDLSVMDMVSTKFIEEQERSICEMSRLLVRATHMGCNGIAEFLFDKEMHRSFVRKGNKKTNDNQSEDKSNLYV